MKTLVFSTLTYLAEKNHLSMTDGRVTFVLDIPELLWFLFTCSNCQLSSWFEAVTLD